MNIRVKPLAAMTRKWAIVIALLSVVFSCKEKVIPDPIDPRLPSFTNLTSNIAGAIINDSAWVAHRECGILRCHKAVRFLLNADSSTLTIDMSGEFTESPDFRALNINIVLNDVKILGLNSYLNLHGRKFKLEGNNYASIDFFDEECRASSGQVYFSKAIKTEDNYVQVEGTFGFEVDDGLCKSYKVYKGRFSNKFN